MVRDHAIPRLDIALVFAHVRAAVSKVERACAVALAVNELAIVTVTQLAQRERASGRRR